MSVRLIQNINFRAHSKVHDRLSTQVSILLTLVDSYVDKPILEVTLAVNPSGARESNRQAIYRGKNNALKQYEANRPPA